MTFYWLNDAIFQFWCCKGDVNPLGISFPNWKFWMDFSEQLFKDDEKLHKDRKTVKKSKAWRESCKQWSHLSALILFSQNFYLRIVLNAGIAHYAQSEKATEETTLIAGNCKGIQIRLYRHVLTNRFLFVSLLYSPWSHSFRMLLEQYHIFHEEKSSLNSCKLGKLLPFRVH